MRQSAFSECVSKCVALTDSTADTGMCRIYSVEEFNNNMKNV